MTQMIRDRQSTINKVERHDLFTKLLEANDDDLDQKSMTEDELIGSLSILTILSQQCETYELSQAIFTSFYLLDMRYVCFFFGKSL